MTRRLLPLIVVLVLTAGSQAHGTEVNWLGIKVNLAESPVVVHSNVIAECPGLEVCVSVFLVVGENGNFSYTVAQSMPHGARVEASHGDARVGAWLATGTLVAGVPTDPSPVGAVGQVELISATYGEAASVYVLTNGIAGSYQLEADPEVVLGSKAGGGVQVFLPSDFASQANLYAGLAGAGVQSTQATEMEEGLVGLFLPFHMNYRTDAGYASPAGNSSCSYFVVGIFGIDKVCSEVWPLTGPPGRWSFWMEGRVAFSPYQDEVLLIVVDAAPL